MPTPRRFHARPQHVARHHGCMPMEVKQQLNRFFFLLSTVLHLVILSIFSNSSSLAGKLPLHVEAVAT